MSENVFLKKDFWADTDLYKVEKSTKLPINDVNEFDSLGNTPLHYAVADMYISTPKSTGVETQQMTQDYDNEEKAKSIRTLIEAGAKVDAKNHNGDTPLHIAATHGYMNTVASLIDNKANLDEQNNHGDTPLHLAVSKGHVIIIKMLVSHSAHESVKNEDGDTPLHLAAMRGITETVNILLHEGINVDERNKNEETPLHLAVYNKHKEITKALLDRWADVNVKDILGNSPLHLAILNGDIGIVNLLIEYDADVNIHHGKSSYTPLDFVSELSELPLESRLEIKKQLLLYGAKKLYHTYQY